MNELKDRWALVTGASSGIGEEIARALASRGANLVLVARREERLKKLASELESAHGVEARVLAHDLGKPGAPRELFERLAAARLELDVLVNNAGFAVFGPFAEIPWEREREMIELDVIALVQLTKLVLPGMLARKRGWILHVASIGAFAPCPTYANYAAAKAYVLSFGEALAYELRRTNVRSTVLSPGVTSTEFFDVSGQRQTLFQKLTIMKPRAVAEAGVRALLAGRPSVVAGIANKLTVFSVRFLPRRLQTAIGYATMNIG